MAASDPQDAIRLTEHVRQEINRLTREQLDAYRSASFLTMSPAQAEVCDVRQESIRKLIEQLWILRAEIKNFKV